MQRLLHSSISGGISATSGVRCLGHRFVAACCRAQRAAISRSAPMVSTLGRVKSSYGRISYGYSSQDGYRVSHVGGRTHYVHRLVAQAFLGPPPTEHQYEVHHVDSNRSNNSLHNLQYVTRSQNVLYSWQRPNRGSAAGAISIPVLGRRVGDYVWQRFVSMIDAERQTGVSTSSVRNCCGGRLKESKGWQFELAEPEAPDTLTGEQWVKALIPDSGETVCGWEVSSFGRMRTPRGRITWGCRGPSGYFSVGVSIGGYQKKFLVHRIVARSFLTEGPPPVPWVINHIDCNPSNNHVENLEYATQSHNIKHSYRVNSRRRSNADAVSKPVWGRRLGSDHWQLYPSGVEAARALDVHPGRVSDCCRGVQRKSNGCEFRFAAPTIPDILAGEVWRTIEFAV
ncbi:unnamed protein product [Prorocentrum cordatum]|uniref:HNH nuclease domain-containing protein n=1 Tax=Prorocentrum cordatum TaxID=2364126 RepID=A0ABN9Y3I9_9DINO|nr:unnamed protein product [Polarella glacialis]